MEFNKAYNRNELVKFLRTTFLPEDFVQEETTLANPKQFQYTQQVTRLGECNSLELVVFEVLHSSVSDARVGLTKEAFRMLADEFCERALVFFVPQDDNSNYRFSLIEITLEQKEGTAKVQRTFSNPHRYSYYLGEGISYHTPNKYLNEAGRVVSIEDLRSRFSVEVLTKAFYQELSDWYAWAVKVVRFPNVLDDKADNEAYNSEAMIRLITRLIFVWFIKQRHLVPDEFFDERYISDHLLKSFTPNAEVTLFGKADNSYYYKGILQNLFFAMLNSPITPEGKDTVSERRFRKSRGDYDNNKLMRHEELFIDPKLFVELANKYVPFLNGGLFDCLDDKDNGKYFDAFTDREEIAKQLIVPDYLFFGEDVGRNIDLSEWYGDKRKKKVSARGIIDILKRYNFTVEENTPFDQDVSLDPELLGKVFENLLASYNPETQTTARKQTGSFYTPREIVQYMVDESLVAHLKRTVGDDLEAEYRKLIQYTDEEPKFTDEQRKAILQSIYQCKVLDPACGSGAFPMGMLQQMVHILNRIDPDNKEWKNMMVKNAISETSEAYLNATDEERKEMVADIERSFNENVNRPDYARKLYLIENCIYGVDIQPIAIQISKLRFFISLVVDQKTNDNPVDNFGIRPLPNLEAKFVAANTLIGIDKKDANLFTSDKVLQKETEMKETKHRIFSAKTVKTKRKHKERIAALRKELAVMLEDIGAVGNEEAILLASWDMFDQNATSSFFDPEWMFAINDGFDIVIGNPPYVQLQSNGGNLGKVYRDCGYTTFTNTGDLYCLMYERGYQLLCQGGFLCYITSNTWMRASYGEKLRILLATKMDPLIVLDFAGLKIFESATVDTNIILLGKRVNSHQTICVATGKANADSVRNLSLFVQQQGVVCDFSDGISWVILSPIEQSIKRKIEAAGTPLKDWNIN
ncbi:MAG: Eco57I restriction-modification methylase domain-containing protein, partial [Bacteroidales bacterium]|nr:Eco57I restriction-modification methylase domain-containing protein [Bacteroidales bacterium]